jgi:hypothetical protein
LKKPLHSLIIFLLRKGLVKFGGRREKLSLSSNDCGVERYRVFLIGF